MPSNSRKGGSPSGPAATSPPSSAGPPAVQSNGGPPAREDPRRSFLAVMALAGAAYMDAVPLSVSAEDQTRVIDRCKAAFRAAAAREPKLYKCTPESLGRAFALCVLSDLTPGGVAPEVYLIPRNRRSQGEGGRWVDVLELDAQISWRGYLALAERAGAVVDAVPVFRGEHFKVIQGTAPSIEHEPDVDTIQTWDTLRCMYVRVDRNDGRAARFLVVGRSQIEARRAVSDGYAAWEAWDAARREGKPLTWPNGDPKKEPSSPWIAWPLEMARKTAIRLASSAGLIPFDPRGRAGLEFEESSPVRNRTEPIAEDGAPPAPALRQIPSAKGSALDRLEDLITVDAEPLEVGDAPAGGGE